MRRSGITLAWLLVLANLCAACSSTTTIRRTSPVHIVSVPQGWKTYIYGKAAISVPSDWAVVKDYNCTGTTAPGALYLGSGKGPPYPSCPGETYHQGDSITITRLPEGATNQSSICPPTSLNALRVYVGPCGSSNVGGIVIYSVSLLEVRAIGEGTRNENVTGPGTGTVVGRVLHTLRVRG